MSEKELIYVSIGKKLNGAVQSQMFGKPCFKVNGKAFICFFQNQMVFKLPLDTREEALKQSGSTLFDPSGKKRPMKEWVQVPYLSADLWTKLAKDSFLYVSKV